MSVTSSTSGTMNEASFEAASRLVSKTYVNQGRDAKRTHEKAVQILIQQVWVKGRLLLPARAS